jgi:hypothetical protein
LYVSGNLRSQASACLKTWFGYAGVWHCRRSFRAASYFNCFDKRSHRIAPYGVTPVRAGVA